MDFHSEFDKLKLGESCIYHAGYLPTDRSEQELVDKDDPKSKLRFTPRAAELDRIAEKAYFMSQINFIFKNPNDEYKELVGTGELELKQRLIKHPFGRRGEPVYEYIAKRIIDREDILDFV